MTRVYVEALPRVPASCPNGHRHFYTASVYGVDSEIVFVCAEPDCGAWVDLAASYPKPGSRPKRRPSWVRGSR